MRLPVFVCRFGTRARSAGDTASAADAGSRADYPGRSIRDDRDADHDR